MDNIVTERENVTKFLGVLTLNFFVSYKSRGIVKQPLLKQFYFSFIHCHLNYVNIACASTCKSKLERIYHHQKHVAHIINFKDRFTHAQSLLHFMEALLIINIILFPRDFFELSWNLNTFSKQKEQVCFLFICSFFTHCFLTIYCINALHLFVLFHCL